MCVWGWPSCRAWGGVGLVWALRGASVGLLWGCGQRSAQAGAGSDSGRNVLAGHGVLAAPKPVASTQPHGQSPALHLACC